MTTAATVQGARVFVRWILGRAGCEPTVRKAWVALFMRPTHVIAVPRREPQVNIEAEKGHS